MRQVVTVMHNGEQIAEAFCDGIDIERGDGVQSLLRDVVIQALDASGVEVSPGTLGVYVGDNSDGDTAVRQNRRTRMGSAEIPGSGGARSLSAEHHSIPFRPKN